MEKILVLTSGGDAPGMNAAIRAVVRSAIYHDMEVYGVNMGFQGLVTHDIYKMNEDSVANCIQRGGTILKTGRYEPFYHAEVRHKAVEYIRQNLFSGLVVLGGDGSFKGAALLAQESNIKVIGLPCTIDNDIVGTEYCIGFDTAGNTALEAIDRIRDTALSHERNFIIEVMGRASGFLAVDVGISGGAEIILIPEFPLSNEELAHKIQKNRRKKMASILVVTEEEGNPGASFKLAEEIEQLTGINYRVCILGHTQRGGSPTLRDRKIASLMGVKAVEALRDGYTNKMVAYNSNHLTLVDFPDPHNGKREFDDKELLSINQILCDI